MTVPANSRRRQYDGNGVAKAFNGPMAYLASHIKAFIVDGSGSYPVDPNQYQVEKLGSTNGTRVTMVNAPAVDTVLLLLRVVPYSQEVDITNQGAFFPETVEKGFDLPVMQIQQLAERQDRSVQISESYVGPVPDMNLPGPAPGFVFGWNADGSGIRNVDYNVGPADLALRADLSDPTGGAALVVFKRPDGTAVTLAKTIREKLAGPRSYYVRTDGNNANNGLSNTAGGAFATIQKAVDTIMENIDLNGYDVTVNVANGTYTAPVGIRGSWTGAGSVYIVGNVASPSSVIIATVGDAFFLERGAVADLRGFRTTTTSGGRGVTAFTGATALIGAWDFGPHPAAAHLEVGTEGTILVNNDYTISGGGSSHFHAGGEGQIRSGNVTATITGNPAFDAYFAGAAQGSIILQGWLFTGTAVGARYLAHKNAIIETHPGVSPALPGTIEGRVAWGGSYVGSNSESYKVQVFPGSGAAIDFQAFDGVTQLFRTILSLVTDPSGTGRGYLFCNGSGSYMSELCHLGCAEQVTMANTKDGISVLPGGEMSQSVNNGAAQYVRRRGSDGTMVQYWRDGTASGSIACTVGATAYNTTSDESLKNWIGQNYDPEWIKKVGAEIGDFTFNHLPEGANNPVRTGTRAQRLYKVAPLAVTPGVGAPGEEGFIPWGVDYAQLVPSLILEVMHLREELEKLKGN